jgi:hypothetical protein
VVLASVPLLAWACVRANDRATTALAALLVVGTLGATLLATASNRAWYARDADWAGFYAYNDARLAATDYDHVVYDEAHAPAFEAIGWSANDARLFLALEWYVELDGRFGKDAITQLSSAFPPYATAWSHYRAIAESLLVSRRLKVSAAAMVLLLAMADRRARGPVVGTLTACPRRSRRPCARGSSRSSVSSSPSRRRSASLDAAATRARCTRRSRGAWPR